MSLNVQEVDNPSPCAVLLLINEVRTDAIIMRLRTNRNANGEGECIACKWYHSGHPQQIPVPVLAITIQAILGYDGSEVSVLGPRINLLIWGQGTEWGSWRARQHGSWYGGVVVSRNGRAIFVLPNTFTEVKDLSGIEVFIFKKWDG